MPTAITDPERRAYLSLLIGLDDSVGRVMQGLRQTGQDKNTLAFVSSLRGTWWAIPWDGWHPPV